MKKSAKQAKRSKKSPRKRRSRASKTPSREARKEAEHFVKSLRANKQLSEGPGPLPPGATHTLETDESGEVHVVRKRYSAF